MLKKIVKIFKFLTNYRYYRFLWGLLFSKDNYYITYYGNQFGNAERKTLQDAVPGIKIADSVQVRNYFDFIPGTSLDLNELLVLVAIAHTYNVKTICEIGTFNGNTAFNLAVNLPGVKITTIDLPLDFTGDLPGITTSLSNVTDRNNVGKCFKGTGYEGERISQVFANSYELDWSCLNTRFDLVLIDGCHHYKYVKRDTENAINFLNDNGIIVWHDYGQIRSLSRAVDSFAQKRELEVFAIKGTRLALGVKPTLCLA